ncbi:MAG: hypothetical protein GY849_09755 [Deltaproteobacteria bacterium]|nr:hypothetical protein [Deltaproteobacteria bacterium]
MAKCFVLVKSAWKWYFRAHDIVGLDIEGTSRGPANNSKIIFAMGSKAIGMVRLIALCWLVFIVAFLTGLYVYGKKIWPYPIVKEFEEFVAGHSEEKTTLAQKIANDLGNKPTRHMALFKIKSSDADKYKELNGLSLKQRRKNPKIFLSDDAPRGYRLIFGIFDFRKHLCGAVLLDPKGHVARVWQTSQADVDWDHRPDSNVFPHGFNISPDGSIVAAYDGGNSLIKYDGCGRIIWRKKGGFHHSIEFEGEDAIWVWGADSLLKIDYETGEHIKVFSLEKVMKANPEIDIFGIRQKDGAESSTWIKGGGGKWHANDIDPLPKELERYYPGFNAGDLLVSLRSPNLVFVMDQNNLKVKWWRQGLTRRQHDPDWNKRGTITIFNNNMHRGYSNILELHPVTFESKVMVDGSKYNFYARIRGKHQVLPNGGILITSSDQGRVFEVDKDGNMTFEFINVYGENNEALAVSEALFLPVDFFKELPQCN